MIADDHPLIRRIVRQVVEQENDLEVIAEACNGHQAETLAAQTQPDVILMDLDMPECDGFEATERVLARSPHSRVVIFTGSQQEQHALHAIQSGAIGYITKDIEPEVLVNAIRSAARDELCIPRALASQVLAHIRTLGQYNTQVAQQRTIAGHPSAMEVSVSTVHKIPQRPTRESLGNQGKIRPLTERESEILELMRLGRKNREIARELSIAESTVHKHIQNIFEKLHARNRTEAIYLTAQTAS